MIVADSYMAMLLPDDIAGRITEFVAGRRSFPFVGRDELMCIMYLYGKSGRISENEIGEAAGLAHRTASQLDQDIDIYANSSANKLDPEYIKSKYINRELQLAIENKQYMKDRMAGDPTILSDCFAQHVAYYRQDYFFELYGPLKDSELTSDIRLILSGRMVMVCCNKKSAQETGLAHPLIPVYVWFRDQAGAKP
ncbi:MAG TPA: hypothetical protein VJZ68_08010 [Nitrososphaera sp.]|nr:hypothetical protein [Nitrososphaera sp.]